MLEITNSTLYGNSAEIAPTIMSKSESITIRNLNMSNNEDSTGFLKNGISSYPLKILNFGDLVIQNEETEEGTVR